MVRPWTDLIPIPETMPETTRCVQVVIPDGIEYVSMLFRALGWLANWTTYQRDTAHTGAQIAELWKQAIAASLPEMECGGMLEDVRQHQTLPCVLEKKLSGEWQPFANLRYCPPNLRVSGGKLQYFDEGLQTWVDYPSDLGGAAPGSQPGEQPGGDEPVPFEECKEIVLTVQGNGMTAVPFRVTPGDTVFISSLTGGWTYNASATSFTWMCGTGKIYALGTCGTTDGDDTGAIVENKPLGKLIAHYGEHYFDAQGTAFPIPLSWPESTLFLQMNDPDLSDNAGSVTAKIEVCAVSWCYEFDFTTGQHGWSAYGGIGADYIAGVGFRDHYVTGWHAVELQYPTTVTGNIRRVEMYGTVTPGSENDYTNLGLDPWKRTAWWKVSGGQPNGTQFWPEWSSPMINDGNLDVAAGLYCGLIASQDSGGTDKGGTCTLTKIKFFGTGANPFGEGNCT